MRISTFWYCLKQGIINICRNILFSLASIATISACIFLFCLFFALIANVQNVAKTAETTVGITVFFDEGMPEEQILAAGDGIRGWEEVREARYISAAQAWENFKAEYFEGMEELAEGFADDNPLSGSASYEIFLNDIEEQDKIVERLEGMEGVRKVRYSSTAVAGLTSAGKMVGAMSAVIICVLLAVAVFLISNTISVAAAFRRRENEIMRLIGATNYMISAPFVVEGVLLGALGAAVPLAGMYVLYQKAVIYIGEHYQMLAGMFEPIPLGDIFPYMAAAAGCLGAGIGFFVSYFTIHRHLKV
uniref:cell division protein FtsX n=1 Tax=Enterocloster clostridioformis TaxID=1531 RepID=UPI0025A56E7E|nr:permease-like cell division protein FtsX [Enterocloster clostridioformis]